MNIGSYLPLNAHFCQKKMVYGLKYNFFDVNLIFTELFG
jgi:hypothetical protein